MGVIGIVIGGMASLGFIYWVWERSRLRKHKGLSRDEFVSYFSRSSVAPEASAAVYDHFERMRGVKGFCPAPADSLERIYGMLGEDLHDELRNIIVQLGTEMPHSGILAEWPDPLETLEDVVRFVNWIRTRQNPSISAR